MRAVKLRKSGFMLLIRESHYSLFGCFCNLEYRSFWFHVSLLKTSFGLPPLLAKPRFLSTLLANL